MSTFFAYIYALLAPAVAVAVVLFVVGFFADKYSGENDQLIYFGKQQMARAVAIALVVVLVVLTAWYLMR